MNEGLKNPVIFFQHYTENETENLQIKAAADMGALIFDGVCDGIFLFNQGSKKGDKMISDKVVDATAFGILQAGRIRTSKTEYISCPGCGRTLYDLESTIARIKAATSHLKGLKIGIMGCIVNGPGEMADADYGYCLLYTSRFCDVVHCRHYLIFVHSRAKHFHCFNMHIGSYITCLFNLGNLFHRLIVAL